VPDIAPRTAIEEWRRYGLVPLAAMIGYSTMAIQTYGIGPFVTSLEGEFGWSRAEIMIGLTISNGLGVMFNFLVGVLADRIGPRRVGLAGVVVKTGAIMLLATVSASVLNWWLLWVLVGLGAVLAQANVWASAVASRFDRGRGFAIAVALSGSSFCAAIIPVIAHELIENFGWRIAFVGIGFGWLVIAFPVVYFLFYGRKEEQQAAAAKFKKAPRDVSLEVAAAAVELPGLSIGQGLRRPAFWQLLIASFAFASYTMAVAPNLVPMLGEKGATPVVAAQLAAIVGIVGIVARISAGFLLDIMSARVLGTFVFALPVAGCALLLGDAPGYLVLTLCMVSFGITIGAEYDVVFYLVSRHFGLRSFASLMGGMLTAGALGGAIAPAVAGRLHDVFGDYNPMLMVLMVLMAAGALAIATMGRPPREFALAHG
jgi:MFS family permease